MGYNTSLAIVHDLNLDEVGVDRSSGLSFDEATSSMNFALVAAQVGPHVVLIDPLYGTEAKPVAERLGRQVYVVSVGSTASTYVIEAEGPVHRVRAISNGELLAHEGEPLAAEAVLAAHEFDEDAHFAVAERLLGSPLSAVHEATFYPVA